MRRTCAYAIGLVLLWLGVPSKMAQPLRIVSLHALAYHEWSFYLEEVDESVWLTNDSMPELGVQAHDDPCQMRSASALAEGAAFT